MTGALIVLAIGFAIIIVDWHIATPRDAKTGRRKRLSPTDRMRMRQLLLAVVVLAAVAYYVPKFLID